MKVDILYNGVHKKVELYKTLEAFTKEIKREFPDFPAEGIVTVHKSLIKVKYPQTTTETPTES